MKPRLPFDVVESNVRVPQVPARTVSRTALVNRLRAAGAFPLVLVVAPAGYGKTTLLSQWAARDARPFAWVSIDEQRQRARCVSEARGGGARQHRADRPASALEPLALEDRSVRTKALPRLANALSRRERPSSWCSTAQICSRATRSATLTALLEHMPAGSMIALRAVSRRSSRSPRSGRGAPCSRSGAYELALSRREAEILLRAAGRGARGRRDQRAPRAHRGLGDRPLPRGAGVERGRGENAELPQSSRRRRRPLLRRLLPLRVPRRA